YLLRRVLRRRRARGQVGNLQRLRPLGSLRNPRVRDAWLCDVKNNLARKEVTLMNRKELAARLRDTLKLFKGLGQPSAAIIETTVASEKSSSVALFKVVKILEDFAHAVRGDLEELTALTAELSALAEELALEEQKTA